MKKLLYSLFFLIIVLITPCISSKASYLPPTLPNTSVVPDFLQNIAQYQIVNDTNTYLPSNDLNALNQLVNGRSIADSMQYVYLDNSSLSVEFGDLYTVNGVEVNSDDTYTVYGTSDIGDFMCICKKDTGEILYQGSGNTAYSTLCGGSGLRESFPEFIVRDLSLSAASTINGLIDVCNNAKLDSMIIYGNSLTSSQKDFLSEYRYYFKLQTNVGWTVWVPNACTSDTVVKPQSSNIYSLHGTFPHNSTYFLDPIIFTNDPSSVYFSGTGSGVGLKQQTNYVYGSSFSYCSSYFQAFDPLGYGFTIDMELPTQSAYNTYKNLSDNAVYLQPVESVDNPNTGDIYNYTDVTNNPPVYNRYINQNYNYDGDTNYNNYPTYYDYEFPTYTTTNEYVNNIYNYYTTPSQGGSIGTIDPNDVTDGIPILNNLKYRFPFSIPFDIYNLINGLSVQREAPHFEWEIFFPVVNYTWEIDFDLSAWDTQASIFRTCFLILFIIALAMWAYNHFFGS